MKSLLCFILLTTVSINVFAQKDFTLTINLPSGFDAKRLAVGFNDGLINKGADLAIQHEKITATGTYYSQYATIWAVEENDDSFEWREFWIQGKGQISITLNDDGKLLFDNLENVRDLRQIEIDNGLKGMEYHEWVNFSDMYMTEKFKGEFTDSLYTVRDKLSMARLQNELLYVQKNKNTYFAFDHFRRNLAKAPLNPDSLLATFHTFPTKFKQSISGKKLGIYLKGQSLKSGLPSPLINLSDAFTDEHFSTKATSDRETLLVFWASWCKPCIKELPKVMQFVEQFSTEKLRTVFITLDTDSTKFRNAVEKYNLTRFNHIYITNEITDGFGINGVPEMYLIDNNGIINYRQSEKNDNDLTGLLGLIH